MKSAKDRERDAKERRGEQDREGAVNRAGC